VGNLEDTAHQDLIDDDDDGLGGDRIGAAVTAGGAAGGTGSFESLPALALSLQVKRTVVSNKKHLSGSMRGEGFFDRGKKETSPVVLTNRKDLTG